MKHKRLHGNIINAITLLQQDISNLEDTVAAKDQNQYNIIMSVSVRALSESELESITASSKQYFGDDTQLHGLMSMFQHFAALFGMALLHDVINQMWNDIDMPERYSDYQWIGETIYQNIQNN